MATARRRIRVNGIVQGVGFRPFVYRLARELHLAGFVNNDDRGVCIEIQGAKTSLDAFTQRLTDEAPARARIIDLHSEEIDALDEYEFYIRESSRDNQPTVLVSPDIATCNDCLRELFDPGDRRYRYPFINCTNCGPRFTIVERVPYDRPNTSMRTFPMCETCEREYNDPSDRRFHAQPNACPACGPQLTLVNRDGKPVDGDPIAATVDLLRSGNIVAIRGLGGFHLAVDPTNARAVATLRERKGRAEKPFALMVADLETAQRMCTVDEQETRSLTDHIRPIVLLPKSRVGDIADTVAPRNNHFGVMLPYTPLHHLLLQDNFEALVMTSGNLTEEPIAIGNDEAGERLADLADAILLHNREILQRCDDSIVFRTGGQMQMVRRARGFVPEPVFLRSPTARRILAVGPEMKNSIALSRNEAVFLSQYVGDLDNPAAFDFFKHNIDHFAKILEIEPEIIACDRHPEYFSTKWAKEQDLPVIEVQHHHAHLASVMVDCGVRDRTIGVILDGTGYGDDGTIWGGEVLIGDFTEFERFAWLDPVPLPGGEAAIKQPWRTALSYLRHTYGDDYIEHDLPPMNGRAREELRNLSQMMDRQLNSPLTSSCGRLFDAVSALTGVCNEVSYDAQAAILLEMAVKPLTGLWHEALPEGFSGGAIETRPLIRKIVREMETGAPVSSIATWFHNTLAEIFTSVAVAARKETGVPRVALGGGVFQNRYFTNYLIDRLKREKFTILVHSQVPTNDGGLALGQIAIADAAIKRAAK